MKIILSITILFMIFLQANGSIVNEETLSGRMKVIDGEYALSVIFYVRNNSKAPIEIALGEDSNPRSRIKPSLRLSKTLYRPSYSNSPTRVVAIHFHSIKIEPDQEVSLGNFIYMIPNNYDENSTLEPQLRLQTRDRKVEYQVDFTSK